MPRHFSASDPSLWNSLPFVDHRHVIAYDWTYRIDDKWKVTQRFQYLLNYEAENYLGNYNLAFDGTNIYRTFVRNDANRSAISTNLDVSGEIETGPFTHKVLVGMDWFRAKIDYPGFNGGDAFIHPINIFGPTYGDIGGVLQYLAGTSRNNMIYRTNWSDFGVYAQDQISAFDDRLHILLGGRWDKTYTAASETYGGSWETCYPGCSGYPMRQFSDKPMLSPRAAVLFKLQDNVSIYGSYVRSLGANNSGSVIDGTRPPPEVGRQWEVGVKTQWLDDRLSASVALFDLRKTNILQADLAHPGLVIPVGEVASRGVEFDLAGKITENLSLIGSYTFDSAKIIDDNYNGNAGKRYNRVAPNVGNLWVKWDNAPGLPQGWEVGAGFYAVDERYGVNDNSWKVPGYVTFDTMMAYRLPVDGHKVTFRFNVKNLTDRKYFDYLDGYAFASYGQPRTFIGSINVAW
jgi:iron complex outermembrane receptor protein